jgi:hypothetical protein
MTYAELIAAIQSYTENTFPATYLATGATVSSTTQLNTFITQAEQRIFNTVQFPSLRRNVTGLQLQAISTWRALLTFLASYSMAVIDASGNYEYLLNKDVNFIRQAYPNPRIQQSPSTTPCLAQRTTNSPVITNELSFYPWPYP